MNKAEFEMGLRLLARANPPSTLYRYRQPIDRTLAEIINQQIYLAPQSALNDPFECSAPICGTAESMRRFLIEVYAPDRGISPTEAIQKFGSCALDFEWIHERRRAAFAKAIEETGFICLSAVPNSIRMWSYYSQAHEGICVGFDTKKRPFWASIKVTYENPSAPLDVVDALMRDPSEIAAHVTLRKAAEWEFEQEYRIAVSVLGDQPRLVPFESSAITEVRFGARIKDDYRTKVMEAISHLPLRPKLIQMGCDHDRFILTESIL